MNNDTLLAIDIGTTSICGVAVSADGELLASVERPNEAGVAGLPPGRAEQDPARIREAAFGVLRELASRVEGVAGVGFTGQMHGMLAVDREGRPLTNLITWQDGRCLEAADDGRTYLDEMRARVPDSLWAACGCRPASGFLGSTLYWMRRRGELPAGVERVCFIHDWLAGLFAGRLPLTDPSDAGSSGVFDLARLDWHAELIAALDLPLNLLPPIQDSGALIGRLSPATAGWVGLPEGTPVCNALGDNQASVLGSCANVESSLLINLGTGGQISWAVPKFAAPPAGMETRYLPRGRCMMVGASLCGGRAFAWLNDFVRAWLRAFGHAADRDGVYARLCELAEAAPPGAGGLTARTTLAGTRADPSARGALEGLSLENASPANLARAVLEGMVEELADLYERGRTAGGADARPTAVVGSGNAVRKNPVLRRIIAQRLGSPVRVPRHREEAAFGAALAAGVGVGLWPDLRAAGRCVRYD